MCHYWQDNILKTFPLFYLESNISLIIQSKTNPPFKVF